MSLSTVRLRRDTSDILRTSPPAQLFLGLNLIALGLALPQPLRGVIVVPLVLFLPGYALLAALGLTSRRDPVTTVGTSLVLSLVIMPLVALALWETFGEVRPANVVMALAFIVLAPAVVGLQPLVTGRRDVVAGGRGGAGGLLRLLAILTAGVLLVTVLVAVLPGAKQAPYTEAAFAGGWKNIDHTILVKPNEPVTVDVQVTNHTGSAQTYVVEPALEGKAWRGATIELGPDATWAGTVSGSVPGGGCLHRLRVGVRPTTGTGALEGPTAWFQTANPLPAKCSVGAAAR
jgi:uncharacterized membrane protein